MRFFHNNKKEYKCKNQPAPLHHQAGDHIEVRVLGAAAVQFVAELAEISERRLSLRCHRPIPADTAVRLDWRNQLVLAEVAGFIQQPEGYLVFLHTEQVIFDMPSLEKSVIKLCGFSECYEGDASILAADFITRPALS